jgi:rhodanese-related sulfurtransferase
VHARAAAILLQRPQHVVPGERRQPACSRRCSRCITARLTCPGRSISRTTRSTRWAATLLPDRDAEIVVYCANAQCQNSHIAAHRLSTLSYSKVAVYPGGKKDWEDGGMPLEPFAAAA